MELKEIGTKMKALAKKNPVLFWGGTGAAVVAGVYFLAKGGGDSVQPDYYAPLEDYGDYKSDLPDDLINPGNYDWGSGVTDDWGSGWQGNYDYSNPYYNIPASGYFPEIVAEEMMLIPEDIPQTMDQEYLDALAALYNQPQGSYVTTQDGRLFIQSDYGVMDSTRIFIQDAPVTSKNISSPASTKWAASGNMSLGVQGTTAQTGTWTPTSQPSANTGQTGNIFGGVKTGSAPAATPTATPAAQRYTTPTVNQSANTKTATFTNTKTSTVSAVKTKLGG